ncbi:MAG TPA: hypothetical protein VK988_12125 [Acidimicrobiales bacterium]|nr:hypothetical protein [Acidimicrobiales bacterium]
MTAIALLVFLLAALRGVRSLCGAPGAPGLLSPSAGTDHLVLVGMKLQCPAALGGGAT